MGLGGELDSRRQRRCFCHLREILLDGHVRAEVKIRIQHVAVNIPHTVEIAGSKPIGVEDLLRRRTSDGVEEQHFELIVREPVLVTGADVIITVPELRRHFGPADALQQPSAILDSSPLQHTADRDMEHDRVVVLQDRRIENAGLTQRDPGLDARIGNDPFRHRFGDTIMVIGRDADRVSCPAPMKRFTAVSHLRYRTYINHFGLLVLGLSQYSFGDILRRGYIRAESCFGSVVGLGRDHAADMKHYICSRHAFQHIVVVREIAPYNAER